MAVAVGVLAGCSSTPSRLTAAELTAGVNEICRAAGQPYGSSRPIDPAAFVNFLQAQLPAQRQGLADLKSLRPPAALQSEWTATIISPEEAQLADEVDAISRLQPLVESGDYEAAASIVVATTERLDARGEGINRYWTMTGATDCLDSSL